MSGHPYEFRKMKYGYVFYVTRRTLTPTAQDPAYGSVPAKQDVPCSPSYYQLRGVGEQGKEDT